ncbi:hypothetical protein K7X08_017284 [Anisodus acutangulus]|uniref:Uncharacterized protein n=1 Tax=Anisodus acutangulus TaxID=402998 RepID=A0A9Q1LTG7_9SOLA|nr:hypothetical protein K7X08_017284 [Anisodus acutangulus]
MQRRENNVQSFEKLRQVRRNLDQAKTILEALIKNEIELFEDTLALPGFPSFPSNVGSSEEEYVDSDDSAISRPYAQAAVSPNLTFIDSKPVMASAGSMRRELKRRYVPHGWLHKLGDRSRNEGKYALVIFQGFEPIMDFDDSGEGKESYGIIVSFAMVACLFVLLLQDVSFLLLYRMSGQLSEYMAN